MVPHLCAVPGAVWGMVKLLIFPFSWSDRLVTGLLSLPCPAFGFSLFQESLKARGEEQREGDASSVTAAMPSRAVSLGDPEPAP